MKRWWLLVALGVLGAYGCIDWDGAENELCSDRPSVCPHDAGSADAGQP